MDELERAWVRNKAQAHYRQTRTPRSRWKYVGIFIAGVASAVYSYLK